MFKKSLLILSFLFALSAKAQNNIHTILHEADVYYSLKENAENLSNRIYNLALNKRLDIYNDSTLKNVLGDYNRLDSLYIIEYVQVIRPGSDDPYDLLDSTIRHPFGNGQLENIIIGKNYLDFYISDTKHFYLQADKVFKLLTKEEKEFYEITVRFLNGKITDKSIMDFSQKGLKILTENMYNLGKNGNINAYKNEEFSEKYSVDEVSHLGETKEYIQIINPATEDEYDLIDTIVYDAFTVDKLKGIKIIYTKKSNSISNFEMNVHAFCPLYQPIIANQILNVTPLFYGNAKDIISSLDNVEKNLWNIILNYHLKRKLDNRFEGFIEDYEKWKIK